MTTQTEPVDSGLSRETDPIAFLIGQHMAIRDLFGVVAMSEGPARAEAFTQLVRLLAAHETAEEQILRPMTRTRVDGGSAIADQAVAEEQQAKVMLAELEKMGTDAPEFPAMLEGLRQAVMLHAHHEEAYEFRYLKQKANGEAPAMTAMLRAAEAVAPTHPHPSVNSATANNLAGPMVSLFDRTRDMVKKALAS
jgi:hypothetical protein